MANEDNPGLGDVPTAPLTTSDVRVYSSRINQVLDDIEASHTTWSGKYELYRRIEILVESNCLKETQIDKLTRQQKFNFDDVKRLKTRITSL